MRLAGSILTAAFALSGAALAQESTPESTPTAEESPAPTPVPSPEPEHAQPTTLPPDAPKLFLDCLLCDGNYLRENVAFVVFVRDRADADVQAIVTSRATGAGGEEFSLRFVGRGRFAGMDDELPILVSPLATDDDRRSAIARGLRLGLSRYAAKTKAGADLDVSFTPPETPALEHDPWDHWVFRIGGNANLAGESSYTDNAGTGQVSAARVTELWKIRSSYYVTLNETEYNLGDDGTGHDLIVTSFRRDQGASVLVGRSLGKHLTAGVRPSWSASTYTNIRTQPAGAATLEWSVFPYEQATRRALIFQYSLRAEHPVYYEETIFDEHEETLFQESAYAGLSLTQPFGSVNISVSGTHYLHDVEKSEGYASVSLDLRLVRGLSLNVYGYLSLLRDQLYLPKGGATQEEILLRRRQLATQYNYYSSIGLSYTFGSIYTPVVNTRLE